MSLVLNKTGCSRGQALMRWDLANTSVVRSLSASLEKVADTRVRHVGRTAAQLEVSSLSLVLCSLKPVLSRIAACQLSSRTA